MASGAPPAAAVPHFPPGLLQGLALPSSPVGRGGWAQLAQISSPIPTPPTPESSRGGRAHWDVPRHPALVTPESPRYSGLPGLRHDVADARWSHRLLSFAHSPVHRHHLHNSNGPGPRCATVCALPHARRRHARLLANRKGGRPVVLRRAGSPTEYSGEG